MNVSNRQTEKTSPVSAANPNQGPSLSSDPRAPALSSRPWFFSLLPVADIRRTEASLNTVQRRFAGVIRLITGSPLFAKDVRTAVNSSQELLKAAEQGTAEEVEKHISSFADINDVDAQGMSAIMHAAKRGDLRMIRALVAAGSRINMGNKAGEDALMLAAKNGRADVVDFLITWGADFTRADNTGCTAFVLAARAGSTAVIQPFIDAGVDIDAPIDNGSTPLMSAAESGHVEFVKELIAKGAEVNKTNIKCKMTAVMYAAREGQTEVVKHLLEKGASVDAKDAYGLTALMEAAYNGHIEVVKHLLAQGASVDAKDAEGYTVLMKAACNGHTEVVKLLLAQGASVDAKDAKGWTALMKAACNGHAEVIKLLLAQGASVDAKDAQGSTVLIKAAMRGHYATLTTLIESGVNQYDALLSVLQYQHDHVTKVIVRAWLNSKKNKFDAVTAINCCTHDTVTNFPAGHGVSTSARNALVEAGLTLTKEERATLEVIFQSNPKTEPHMKKFLFDARISREGKIGNAYWSGNHALVDKLIDAPFITFFNPLGLVSPANLQNFKRNHYINDDGDYLHAIGRLHDESPKVTWDCDVDPMVEAGWRSKVAATLRSARNEATEASKQISRLLADPGRGFTLIDKDGQPMPATNIQLKDTLFAFELERNEPLHQIVNPPVKQSLTKAQVKHQNASQAQAKAILASNNNYSRLKLNMPALAQAKDLEKQVRSGELTGAGAATKLDELLSETEQTYLDAPSVIPSDLAYHWFISEVGEVYETLKTMRDQFNEASPAVPA